MSQQQNDRPGCTSTRFEINILKVDILSEEAPRLFGGQMLPPGQHVMVVETVTSFQKMVEWIPIPEDVYLDLVEQIKRSAQNVAPIKMDMCKQVQRDIHRQVIPAEKDGWKEYQQKKLADRRKEVAEEARLLGLKVEESEEQPVAV